MSIRIVCISDTHMEHEDLTIPDGDILIHSGDFLNFTRNFKRSSEEVLDFVEWFSQHKHSYKILIGGNHDLILEADLSISKLLLKYNIIYLNNSGITIDIKNKKIKIYGSPNTNLTGMAFGKTNAELEKIWSEIPTDVDILITHSAPFHVLDMVNGKHVGDQILLKKVKEIMPKYHIFGHIHEGHGFIGGTSKGRRTVFINASIGDHKDEKKGLPIIFTYKN